MAATAAIIAAIIGAGGSLAGGYLARPSTTGGTKEALKAQQLSPLGGGGLEQGLRLQAMLQIGADPDEIAKELWSRNLETTLGPLAARQFLQTIDTANAKLTFGDVAGAQALITPYNQQFAGYDTRRRKKKSGSSFMKALGATYGFFGGPAGMKAGAEALGGDTYSAVAPAPTGGGPLRIEDGQIVVDIPGGLGDQVYEAFDLADEIYSNRLVGLGNLSQLAADFPVATEQNLTDMTRMVLGNLRGDIDRDTRDQTAQILQGANVSRINPAGILGRLEEQRSIQYRNADETALSRAVQLLGGRQTLASNSIAGIQQALEPTLTNSLIGVGNLAANSSNVGAAQQQAFLNLLNQNQTNSTQALGAGVGGAGASAANSLNFLALLKAIKARDSGGPAASAATTQYGPLAGDYGFG